MPRVSVRKRTAKSRKSKGVEAAVTTAAAIAAAAAEVSESMSDLPSAASDEAAAAAAVSASASENNETEEQKPTSRQSKKKKKSQRRASSAAPPSKPTEPIIAAAAASAAVPALQPPQSNRGTARSRKSTQRGTGAGALPSLQGVKAIPVKADATTPMVPAAATPALRRTESWRARGARRKSRRKVLTRLA